MQNVWTYISQRCLNQQKFDIRFILLINIVFFQLTFPLFAGNFIVRNSFMVIQNMNKDLYTKMFMATLYMLANKRK